MPIDLATRVNYFDRQYLRLPELRDEQAYHIALRRRHDLSHHSWGIVVGLELLLQGDGRPAVQPGVAVDGYGRELVLVDRGVFGRDVFDRLGTTRLDLWVEYRLDLADDRLAPVECGGTGDPYRRYRATERAEIVARRGGAPPDPRRPPGVPPEALQAPQLATPDDPAQPWPVYLGRVVMQLSASGDATFVVDGLARPYAGLVADVVDHPGNAARLELGHRPQAAETRTIGDAVVTYAAGPDRDFAVFVPPPPETAAPGASAPLEPTLAVTPDATRIRGVTELHGNLVLDGASVQFPDAARTVSGVTDGNPAIYRYAGAGKDELRLDVGDLADGKRRLLIGLTKDGNFQTALEIAFEGGAGGGAVYPVVTVHGDLHVEGVISCDDVRARTVTEEVAALLTGMVQAGTAAGGT
jgi:hypothetical protein